jgi:sulfate/thiosulfate transport system ATP-binding protein
MAIIVENVSKQFGSFTALDQVSLEIKNGGLVALLGPSGSGKSTLLRTIAGLEVPDSGRIWLANEDATNKTVEERNIGFVFQHYALFKHMTIRQNIGFGLEIRKIPKKAIQSRVNDLMELIQLQGLGERYPNQLSGGQRQRVALARALAVEPEVLLLDEPFGALDAKVRKDLRDWLRKLHDEVNVTTVFVTHDQEEAMEVADEIVVMNKGKIEQIGSPAEIYDHPATPFVMSFIGPVNILNGSSCLLEDHSSSADSKVFVRPHDVLVEREQTSPNSTPAYVKRLIHLGWEVQVELSLENGETVKAVFTKARFQQLELEVGQKVYVRPNQIKSFASDYVI